MSNVLTSITDYLLSQSGQIVVMVVGVAAACWLLRRASAHWRYLLWMIVLAKCLVPTVVTVPVAVLPGAARTNSSTGVITRTTSSDSGTVAEVPRRAAPGGEPLDSDFPSIVGNDHGPATAQDHATLHRQLPEGGATNEDAAQAEAWTPNKGPAEAGTHTPSVDPSARHDSMAANNAAMAPGPSTPANDPGVAPGDSVANNAPSSDATPKGAPGCLRVAHESQQSATGTPANDPGMAPGAGVAAVGWGWREWGAIGWMIGVGGWLGLAGVRAWRIRRFVCAQRRAAGQFLEDEVRGLAGRLGLRGTPAVWLVDGVSQPFVWGLVRGSIYLPGNFHHVESREHRRGILMHELAHVARYDAAVNLVQVIVQAAFWFHPLVWWANRKIRQEREKCCDEVAIAQLGASPKEYGAGIISSLVRACEKDRAVSSLAVAGPARNIEERIRTIMQPNRKFQGKASRLAVASVVMVGMVAVPATVVLTARADAEQAVAGSEAGPAGEATATQPAASQPGVAAETPQSRPNPTQDAAIERQLDAIEKRLLADGEGRLSPERRERLREVLRKNTDMHVPPEFPMLTMPDRSNDRMPIYADGGGIPMPGTIPPKKGPTYREHVFKPGDVVRIFGISASDTQVVTVFRAPINEVGNISVPGVGDIHLGGLGMAEAQTFLIQKLVPHVLEAVSIELVPAGKGGQSGSAPAEGSDGGRPKAADTAPSLDSSDADSPRGSPFAAILRNGVVVELVGLTQMKSDKARTWWKPDGQPMAAPYDKIEDAESQERQADNVARFGEARQVVLRLEAGRPGSVDARLRTDQKLERPVYQDANMPVDVQVWTGMGGLRWPFYTLLYKDGQRLGGVFAMGVVLPNSPAALAIGVAAGRWNTVASGTAGRTVSVVYSLGRATFADTQEKDGKTSVVLRNDLLAARNFDETWQRRIVAVDKEGKVHMPVSMEELSDTAERKTRATFENLPLGQIREFQLQLRRYYYVRFQNVANEPGQETDVKVLGDILLPAVVRSVAVPVYEGLEKIQARPMTVLDFFTGQILEYRAAATGLTRGQQLQGLRKAAREAKEGEVFLVPDGRVAPIRAYLVPIGETRLEDAAAYGPARLYAYADASAADLAVRYTSTEPIKDDVTLDQPTIASGPGAVLMSLSQDGLVTVFEQGKADPATGTREIRYINVGRVDLQNPPNPALFDAASLPPRPKAAATEPAATQPAGTQPTAKQMPPQELIDALRKLEETGKGQFSEATRELLEKTAQKLAEASEDLQSQTDEVIKQAESVRQEAEVWLRQAQEELDKARQHAGEYKQAARQAAETLATRAANKLAEKAGQAEEVLRKVSESAASQPAEAVKPGAVKWTFSTGRWQMTAAAIGTDGTIYVGSEDKALHAVRPDGTQTWACRLPERIHTATAPAVGPDGTIYVGCLDKKLYAISPDGTMKWGFAADDTFYACPAIGADGTVYIGSRDKNVYAIRPDGQLRWKFETGGFVTASAVIGGDGTIYVGCDDKNLYAISPAGQMKWQFGTGGSIQAAGAIGRDGTIYVGSTDGNLYAVGQDGRQQWAFRTGNGIEHTAAVGKDGTIYCGSRDGSLYAVNPDGTLRWEFNWSSGNAVVTSSPVVDANGIVCCTWSGSGVMPSLIAVTPAGKSAWSTNLKAVEPAAPALAPDGTLYVPAQHGKLYAIRAGAPLAESAWPMFQHDLRHTGRAEE